MKKPSVKHWIFWTLMILGAGLRASPDTLLLHRQYRQALSDLEAGENIRHTQSWAHRALEQLSAQANASPIPLQLRILNLLGDLALETGQYKEATNYFDRSEAMLSQFSETDPELSAETFHKIGNFHRELKNVEKAETYFQKTLNIRLQIYGKDHLKVADTYNNIGDCMYLLGDFDKALEYHEQVLLIRLEQLPEHHPKIAKSYNNRGLCWQQKSRIQFAKTDFEQALNIYTRTPESNRNNIDVGHLHLNLGNVYDALFLRALERYELPLAEEHFESSLDHYRMALRSYRKNLPANHPSTALCFNNLANAHAKHNRYDAQANRLHRQALEIRVAHYGPVHPDVAEIHYNMAQGYISAGALEPTLEQFQACLHALNYHPERDTGFQRVNNHSLLINTFNTLGTIYQSLYSATLDTTYLQSAFGYYLESDRLFDFLRKHYETTGSQLQLAKTSYQIYDAAIQAANDLYQITDDTAYLKSCFRFSEKSKGLLLLSAIKRNSPEVFHGIPREKLTEISTLEKEIAEQEKRRFLEEGRPGRADNHSVDSIGRLVFDYKQQLTSKIDALQASYPQYYDLIYATEPLSIRQIQQELLEPGQTIVEYFPGIESVYIFVINQGGFTVKRIPLPPNFSLLIYSFSSSIQQFSYVSSNAIADNVRYYRESALQLYQVLFEPIRDLLGDEVIIIPGGELETLPFEALLTKAPDKKTPFNDYPFLIRDFAISYNYSASLLREMKSRPLTTSRRPYLGVAPEFLPDDPNGLTALHYNEKEIRNIRRLVRGEMLLNTQATKSAFLDIQQHYRILHLATHGLSNSSESNFSYLAFGIGDGNRTPEESLLYVKEIYNLSTNAEMVVLSACQTGVGELQKGEGIASIARSFSYAGARSLLATQWSVDDKTTSQLMELFFRNIKNGMSKDQALRAAKLQFIAKSNRRDAHPYFWAAFVPIGDMTPIRLFSPLALLWLLLPLPFVAYLVFFWVKVRKMDRLLQPEYSHNLNA